MAYSSANSITEENKNDAEEALQGKGTDKALIITRRQHMLVQEGHAPVWYQAWNGEAVVDVEDPILDYNFVPANQTDLGTDGQTTWYVLANSVNANARYTVHGTVNLILTNDAQFNVNKGITTTGATLNIYGQKQGENTSLGELSATSPVEGDAAIGGTDTYDGGTLNIHGGKVTAKGGKHAAGIGGGNGGAGGTVTIYGGEVKGQASEDASSIAAGIGGGNRGGSGTVAIYGGTVTTTGGKDASGIGASVGVTSIDLTLGDGMVLATGPDLNNLLPCLDFPAHRAQDVADSETASANIAKLKIVKVWPHTHALTYQTTEDNYILRVICNDEDNSCSFLDKMINLKVDAQDVDYDGQSHGATLTASEMAHPGLEFSGIAYAIKDGAAVEDTPVNVGTYIASITMGGKTASKEYTIRPVNLSNVSVSQVGTLAYNGLAQSPEVSTAATTVDGTSATFAYSLTAEGPFGVMPTITDVSQSGTTFYYKASAPNHNDTIGSFTVTMVKGEATVPTGVTATYGDTLADVALPTGWSWADAGTTAVGDVGDHVFIANYEDVNGNYNPQNNVELTVKVEAANATITTPPTALNLTYTGEEQALIDISNVEYDGGTMMYSTDGERWSNAAPTATEPGSYSVQYQVVADANHISTDRATLVVIISEVSPAKPSPETLVYNGEAQKLVTGGQVTGGELQYALGQDASNAPALERFDKEIPTGVDADTYFVWYRVKGDPNHNDVPPPASRCPLPGRTSRPRSPSPAGPTARRPTTPPSPAIPATARWNTATATRPTAPSPGPCPPTPAPGSRRPPLPKRRTTTARRPGR